MNRSTRTMTAVALVALFCGALATVAAEGAKNLLKDPTKADAWRFEQHEQGKGSMKVDGDVVLFEVTAVDSESWHVQAFLTRIDLKEGKEYTFSYKAKAEPARSIAASAGIDEEDWHPVGLQEDVTLTAEWKEYAQTFKAENVAKEGKNRIGFVLGGEKGKVWVKDLSLTEK